jgi:lipopolysaccharide transport system ATP-binding protein
LEPDILLVDEVLAVGDTQFQKKCLGKMEQAGREGRTVLFISHNMNAVSSLCNKALLLERGMILQSKNDVRSVIKSYIYGSESDVLRPMWENLGGEFENPWFFPRRFYLADEEGTPLTLPVPNDEQVYVYIEGDVRELDPALTIGYAIYTEDGALLYWTYQTDAKEQNWPKLPKGTCTIRSPLPRLLFNEGVYRVELIGSLHFRMWLFEPGRNTPFVFMSIQGGLSDSPYWMIKRPGILAPVIGWTLVC